MMAIRASTAGSSWSAIGSTSVGPPDEPGRTAGSSRGSPIPRRSPPAIASRDVQTVATSRAPVLARAHATADHRAQPRHDADHGRQRVAEGRVEARAGRVEPRQAQDGRARTSPRSMPRPTLPSGPAAGQGCPMHGCVGCHW